MLPKRLIALFTLIAFCSTSVTQAYGASSTPAPKLENQTQLPLIVGQLTLPANLGKVEEFYTASSGKPSVIILQDAHSIPDAQRSLYKLIEHFEKKYGVKHVGVEGASSPLDAQIFQSFPDQKALQEIMQPFASRGELAGSVAAAMFSREADVQYQGVEDWELYEQSIGLYLAAMEEESALSSKLKVESSKLEEKKSKTYSKELLEIDRALQDFHGNTKNLEQVLKALAKVEAPHGGSELAALVEEIERAGVQDQQLEMEVSKIGEKLKKYLKHQKVSDTETVSDTLRTYNQKYQEFQTSQITPQAFALFLKELMAEQNIRIKLSERLQHLTSNQKTIQQIQGTKFFESFEAYAQSVKEKLFRTDEERRLDSETRELDLLEKLVKLELSREDWEVLKGREGERANGREYEMHRAFYNNAELRDHEFLKNLTKIFSHSPTHPSTHSALLIAGGFHAQGLTKRLREQDISYALVMPEIASISDDNAYQAHMRGEVSWKNYFKIQNGKVNLYESFVRAVRDQLLKVEGERAKVEAKQWRDQIIRDLADKKKIEKAGDYTRFIDELNSTSFRPRPSAFDQGMKKVERFLSGLQRLESKNQLTEQNILQLLKPGSAQSPAAGVLPLVPGQEIRLGDSSFVRSEMRTFETGLEDAILSTDGKTSYQMVPPVEAVPFVDAAFKLQGIIAEDQTTKDDIDDKPSTISLQAQQVSTGTPKFSFSMIFSDPQESHLGLRTYKALKEAKNDENVRSIRAEIENLIRSGAVEFTRLAGPKDKSGVTPLMHLITLSFFMIRDMRTRKRGFPKYAVISVHPDHAANYQKLIPEFQQIGAQWEYGATDPQGNKVPAITLKLNFEEWEQNLENAKATGSSNFFNRGFKSFQEDADNKIQKWVDRFDDVPLEFSLVDRPEARQQDLSPKEISESISRKIQRGELEKIDDYLAEILNRIRNKKFASAQNLLDPIELLNAQDQEVVAKRLIKMQTVQKQVANTEAFQSLMNARVGKGPSLQGIVEFLQRREFETVMPFFFKLNDFQKELVRNKVSEQIFRQLRTLEVMEGNFNALLMKFPTATLPLEDRGRSESLIRMQETILTETREKLQGLGSDVRILHQIVKTGSAWDNQLKQERSLYSAVLIDPKGSRKNSKNYAAYLVPEASDRSLILEMLLQQDMELEARTALANKIMTYESYLKTFGESRQEVLKIPKTSESPVDSTGTMPAGNVPLRRAESRNDDSLFIADFKIQFEIDKNKIVLSSDISKPILRVADPNLQDAQEFDFAHKDFPSKFVSRSSHFALRYEEGEWFFRDMGSKNGTGYQGRTFKLIHGWQRLHPVSLERIHQMILDFESFGPVPYDDPRFDEWMENLTPAETRKIFQILLKGEFLDRERSLGIANILVRLLLWMIGPQTQRLLKDILEGKGNFDDQMKEIVRIDDFYTAMHEVDAQRYFESASYLYTFDTILDDVKTALAAKMGRERYLDLYPAKIRHTPVNIEKTEPAASQNRDKIKIGGTEVHFKMEGDKITLTSAISQPIEVQAQPGSLEIEFGRNQFPDKLVSSKHFALQYDGAGIWLFRDLGSRNGTYHKGKRYERQDGVQVLGNGIPQRPVPLSSQKVSAERIHQIISYFDSLGTPPHENIDEEQLGRMIGSLTANETQQVLVTLIHDTEPQRGKRIGNALLFNLLMLLGYRGQNMEEAGSLGDAQQQMKQIVKLELFYTAIREAGAKRYFSSAADLDKFEQVLENVKDALQTRLGTTRYAELYNATKLNRSEARAESRAEEVVEEPVGNQNLDTQISSYLRDYLGVADTPESNASMNRLQEMTTEQITRNNLGRFQSIYNTPPDLRGPPRRNGPAIQRTDDSDLWNSLLQRQDLQAIASSQNLETLRGVFLSNPELQAAISNEATHLPGLRLAIGLKALELSKQNKSVEMIRRYLLNEFIPSMEKAEQRYGIFNTFGTEYEVMRQFRHLAFDDTAASYLWTQVLGGTLGRDEILEYAIGPSFSWAVQEEIRKSMRAIGFLPSSHPWHSRHASGIYSNTLQNLVGIQEISKYIMFADAALHTSQGRLDYFSGKWKPLDKKSGADNVIKVGPRSETPIAEEVRLEYRAGDGGSPNSLHFIQVMHGLMIQTAQTAWKLYEFEDAEVSEFERQLVEILNKFWIALQEGAPKNIQQLLEKNWFEIAPKNLGSVIEQLRGREASAFFEKLSSAVQEALKSVDVLLRQKEKEAEFPIEQRTLAAQVDVEAVRNIPIIKMLMAQMTGDTSQQFASDIMAMYNPQQFSSIFQQQLPSFRPQITAAFEQYGSHDFTQFARIQSRQALEALERNRFEVSPERTFEMRDLYRSYEAIIRPELPRIDPTAFDLGRLPTFEPRRTFLIPHLFDSIRIFILNRTTSFPSRQPSFWFAAFTNIISFVLSTLYFLDPSFLAAGLAGFGVSLGFWMYRGYQALIQSGARQDPDLTDWRFTEDEIFDRDRQRVHDRFNSGRRDGVNVTIADDIRVMDVRSFVQRYLNKMPVPDGERRILHYQGILRQFRESHYFDAVKRILYVNHQGASADTFVNNALFGHHTNRDSELYVHQQAAEATDFALGFVLAHEHGKRRFFQSAWNRIPALSFAARFLAEVYGKINELLYLFSHLNFLPQSLTWTLTSFTWFLGVFLGSVLPNFLQLLLGGERLDPSESPAAVLNLSPAQFQSDEQQFREEVAAFRQAMSGQGPGPYGLREYVDYSENQFRAPEEMSLIHREIVRYQTTREEINELERTLFPPIPLETSEELWDMWHEIGQTRELLEHLNSQTIRLIEATPGVPRSRRNRTGIIEGTYIDQQRIARLFTLQLEILNSPQSRSEMREVSEEKQRLQKMQRPRAAIDRPDNELYWQSYQDDDRVERFLEPGTLELFRAALTLPQAEPIRNELIEGNRHAGGVKIAVLLAMLAMSKKGMVPPNQIVEEGIKKWKEIEARETRDGFLNSIGVENEVMEQFSSLDKSWDSSEAELIWGGILGFPLQREELIEYAILPSRSWSTQDEIRRLLLDLNFLPKTHPWHSTHINIAFAESAEKNQLLPLLVPYIVFALGMAATDPSRLAYAHDIRLNVLNQKSWEAEILPGASEDARSIMEYRLADSRRAISLQLVQVLHSLMDRTLDVSLKLDADPASITALDAAMVNLFSEFAEKIDALGAQHSAVGDLMKPGKKWIKAHNEITDRLIELKQDPEIVEAIRAIVNDTLQKTERLLDQAETLQNRPASEDLRSVSIIKRLAEEAQRAEMRSEEENPYASPVETTPEQDAQELRYLRVWFGYGFVVLGILGAGLLSQWMEDVKNEERAPIFMVEERRDTRAEMRTDWQILESAAAIDNPILFQGKINAWIKKNGIVEGVIYAVRGRMGWIVVNNASALGSNLVLESMGKQRLIPEPTRKENLFISYVKVEGRGVIVIQDAAGQRLNEDQLYSLIPYTSRMTPVDSPDTIWIAHSILSPGLRVLGAGHTIARRFSVRNFEQGFNVRFIPDPRYPQRNQIVLRYEETGTPSPSVYVDPHLFKGVEPRRDTVYLQVDTSFYALTRSGKLTRLESLPPTEMRPNERPESRAWKIIVSDKVSHSLELEEKINQWSQEYGTAEGVSYAVKGQQGWISAPGDTALGQTLNLNYTGKKIIPEPTEQKPLFLSYAKIDGRGVILIQDSASLGLRPHQILRTVPFLWRRMSIEGSAGILAAQAIFERGLQMLGAGNDLAQRFLYRRDALGFSVRFVHDPHFYGRSELILRYENTGENFKPQTYVNRAILRGIDLKSDTLFLRFDNHFYAFTKGGDIQRLDSFPRSESRLRTSPKTEEINLSAVVEAVLNPVSPAQRSEAAKVVRNELRNSSMELFAERFRKAAEEKLQGLAVTTEVTDKDLMMGAIDEWAEAIAQIKMELVLGMNIDPNMSEAQLDDFIEALLKLNGQLGQVIFWGDTKKLDAQVLRKAGVNFTTVRNPEAIRQSLLISQDILPSIFNEAKTNFQNQLLVKVRVDAGGEEDTVLQIGEAFLQVALSLLLASELKSADQLKDKAIQAKIIGKLFAGYPEAASILSFNQDGEVSISRVALKAYMEFRAKQRVLQAA